jgi:hypothetical protein
MKEKPETCCCGAKDTSSLLGLTREELNRLNIVMDGAAIHGQLVPLAKGETVLQRRQRVFQGSVFGIFGNK